MSHTRLDSLLLAGVGTLAVHEIAYIPGSIGTSVTGNGVSHAHIPLLWGVGGAVAIVVLVRYIVASMRSRQGDRFVDPSWLGVTMAALYISQEAAERALSGSTAASLLSEWVLWLGLVAVPVVALVLARLVRCIVDMASAPARGPATRRVRSAGPAVNTVTHPPVLGRLAYALSRRGPPLRIAL